MKKMYLMIAVVLLSVVVLNGCSLGGNVQETTQEKSEEALQVNQPDPDLDKNNAIAIEALKTGNIEGCGQISYIDSKKRCEQTIQANMFSSEAIAKSDKTLCAKIELERYAKECVTIVENNQKRDEYLLKAQEKDEEEDAKRLSVESKAVEAQDASICEQIIDQSQITSCKYNVLANKALKENNAAICDQIGDAVFVSMCKESVTNFN